MRVKDFNVAKWSGVVIFLIGIIILSAISFYPIYDTDVDDDSMLFSVRFGMTWMIIGGAIILIDISVERYREYKEMSEKIPEEDLRP
ncbi:MAG: hypothetical protein SVK08_06895 [Halobacteriota archaeon]|nr:hypothetical protein [Halobacteriota archaeon]